MRYRFLAVMAALTWMWAMPAAAQQLSLNALSNYLNQLTSAEASFTQINADGTISTGTLYMRRPGKVRFEYNPPEQALVMANNGAVVVFDRKLGGEPETYPLNRTPLGLILARNVDLGRANMVVAHGYDGTATTVTAQDPENPEYGSIQLKFTDNPVELRQWVITDDGGGQTTVVLGAWERKQLANRLFNIEQERTANR
ncbi:MULTISPECIES: LolA family protein [Marivita]|jgi:outer membrane lipoprotein-sorting protein|uniref:Outer membrane lipoprotein carrier protein LolA n=1 Tax=Marivita cryptomonadis TaxID=505252 RepID=A0A9Q2P6D8_9RHOB|nr:MULTISPECIES: outer membrane lipoprotein carrier protein LolA [Marivita]MCR9168777.1 outer membrane lipoprotein carrier protein LolA [Paracoccaceae bacterium]MBM2319858.1 outer membrane lipoprotein carrier protein LolA [Marivita cryptomonadis]MBM2329437.1 outer membrane lipoprotein carrier protein LolA [Marivita cryptomonadis]MBM2339025.1 outer membrane lipoprotein carrier protein LolA [Marivita cryptomonadis]MBM2343683.1 outer membrane lipoprotein carrier protein LolA [Marivita cryptomonad